MDGDAGAQIFVVIVTVLIGALAVLLVVAIISAGVKKGMESAKPRGESDFKRSLREAQNLENIGPGIYLVEGVQKENSKDVAFDVSADSAANAKVKVELTGVVVTRVRFLKEHI